MRVEPTEQIVPAMAKAARFEHAPAAAAATVAAAARAVGAAAAVRVLRDAEDVHRRQTMRAREQASGVHGRRLDHRHRSQRVPLASEDEGCEDFTPWFSGILRLPQRRTERLNIR